MSQPPEDKPPTPQDLSTANPPSLLDPADREGLEGRILDPATALAVDGAVDPRPTVYVGPRLSDLEGESNFDGGGGRAARGRRAARVGAWSPEREDRRTAKLRFGRPRCAPRSMASNRATLAPDGWALLQQTRAPVRRRGGQGGRAGPRGVPRARSTSGHPFDERPPVRRRPPAAGAATRCGTYARAGQRRPAADGVRRTSARTVAHWVKSRPTSGRSDPRHRLLPALLVLTRVVKTDVKLGHADQLHRSRDRSRGARET